MKKKISTLISLLLTATLILSTPLTTFAAEITSSDEILVETAEADSLSTDKTIVEETSDDTPLPVTSNVDEDVTADTAAPEEADVANDACSSIDSAREIIYQDDLLTVYAPDEDSDPDSNADSDSLYDDDSITCDSFASASGVTYTSDETEIYNRIMALQSKYPHGDPWGLDKTWSGELVWDDGGKDLVDARACAAFALTIQDEVFGDAPKYWDTYNENHRPTYDDLHVGDYVGMDHHAQILISKTPTKLTWVAGNVGGEIWWDPVRWAGMENPGTTGWVSTDYVLEHADTIITCQPRYFTCTFDTLGGPTINSVTTDLYGYVTLPTPTWEGYKFEGWYVNEQSAKNTASTSGKIQTNTYEMHKDKTLYARWEQNSTPTPTPSNPKLSAIAFNVGDLEMTVGTSQSITASISPANANVEFEWKVTSKGDKNVIDLKANTNNSKTIVAKEPGNATITVTVTDKTYGNVIEKSVTVHVAEKLETPKATCFVGEQIDLNLRFFNGQYPATRYPYALTAESFKLLSIKNGIGTLKKSGIANIAILDPQKYNTIEEITIIILPKPVLKFPKSMTYKSQTLNIYDCFTNLDNPLDYDAVQKIHFEHFVSSKPAVASISNEGIITAKAPGTTSITAYIAENGKDGAMKTVTVKASLSVKVPAFAKTVYTMKTGQKLTIAMKNVTANSGATFSSSDPDLVTATAEIKKDKPTGKVVLNAVNASADTDSITLTATIDGQNYTVPVTIVKPKINAATKTLKVKKTFTVKLSNTSYKVADIQWISTDPSVATVASNGKITAVSPGTTTVYTEKGGIRNECVVTVTN